MADKKKERNLDVSSLSSAELNFEHLRKLKPISQKEFELLPAETQERLCELYDQSKVIWNDESKMRDLSGAEIISLLEPYKTRAFKNFPKFLKDDLLGLYAQAPQNPKSTKLLLWFVDKRDFADKTLPDEIKSFLDYAYSRSCDEYDAESIAVLLDGIKKLHYMDLTTDQKKFVNEAFSQNIDEISNEELYALVGYAKSMTALDVPHNMLTAPIQQFVLDCYKRCTVKAETSAYNKKMTGAWHQDGRDQYRCFAAFNRAFVGLSALDRAMYFENPTKKLNLENMINYANLQAAYVGNGNSFNFKGDVYDRTKMLADRLGLPIIYAVYHQSYHYAANALLPYTKVNAYYLDEADGIIVSETDDEKDVHLREYNVETLRDYKEKVAAPLAKTFDNMIEYVATVATKNVLSDNISPEEQYAAAQDIVRLFDGQLTESAAKYVLSQANDFELKRDNYVAILQNMLHDLLDSNAIKDQFLKLDNEKTQKKNKLVHYLQNLSEKELDDWLLQKHSAEELAAYYDMMGEEAKTSGGSSKRETSPENRFREVSALVSSKKSLSKLSPAEQSELIDEYYELEDRLHNK